MLALAAAVLSLAAQAGAPPDPTAPPAADAPPADAPPISQAVPLVPFEAPPPPPVNPTHPEAPPPPSATPAPDQKKKKPKLEESHGLDPLATGLVQVAAGTGGCCVGCCVSLVPFFGFSIIPGLVGGILASVSVVTITGATVGGTEGIVGDLFGNDRAPLLWPVLTSVGAMTLTTGGLVALAAFAPAIPGNATTLPASYTPFAFGELGVIVVGTAATLILPAVVYAATSSPKQPGDVGQGFPGIVTPAAPEPKGQKTVTVALNSGAVAMAY
jgi:hypothetical protein